MPGATGQLFLSFEMEMNLHYEARPSLIPLPLLHTSPVEGTDVLLEHEFADTSN